MRQYLTSNKKVKLLKYDGSLVKKELATKRTKTDLYTISKIENSGIPTINITQDMANKTMSLSDNSLKITLNNTYIYSIELQVYDNPDNIYTTYTYNAEVSNNSIRIFSNAKNELADTAWFDTVGVGEFDIIITQTSTSSLSIETRLLRVNHVVISNILGHEITKIPSGSKIKKDSIVLAKNNDDSVYSTTYYINKTTTPYDIKRLNKSLNISSFAYYNNLYTVTIGHNQSTDTYKVQGRYYSTDLINWKLNYNTSAKPILFKIDSKGFLSAFKGTYRYSIGTSYDDGKSFTSNEEVNNLPLYCNGKLFSYNYNENDDFVPSCYDRITKTLTKCTVPNGLENFNNIVYFNNKYIGAASTGLYYSTDGITWTQSSYKLEGSTFHNFKQIGNTLVTSISRYIDYVSGTDVNEQIGLWYSTDGKTWTQSNIKTGYYNITYFKGLLIAMAYYSYNVYGILYSTDGKTWTKVLDVKLSGSSPTYDWYSFPDIIQIRTGNSAGVEKYYESTDGKVWKEITFSDMLPEEHLQKNRFTRSRVFSGYSSTQKLYSFGYKKELLLYYKEL